MAAPLAAPFLGNTNEERRAQRNRNSQRLPQYKFPWDRLKTRKNPLIAQQHADVPLDAGADIYDYLIIFTRVEDAGVGGLEELSTNKAPMEGSSGRRKFEALALFGTNNRTSNNKPPVERVSWKDVCEFWFQAIPGDEDKKNRGVELLEQEWLSRFRTGTVSSNDGGDTIPKLTFQSLVREHVVDILMRKAGLQLNIKQSSIGDKVYCLIRAPTALLEKKAEEIKYKLKFKGEVDPGVDFWQKKEDHDADGRPIYVELQEEAELYDKNQANEILEDLYHAGKIKTYDAKVNDIEEPTKKHWSRRIHTLERIADRVPVTNRYPAYAEFNRKPTLRHLYSEYSSNRGDTLFIAKDRLYLTKAILDDHFDFGVLVENGAVEACFSLHDASRDELVTRSWLTRHWVFPMFYSTSWELGAPFVSHTAIESNEECPYRLRPWAQPLMEVRSYFGEKIALYFAWVGYYGYSLLSPTVAAVACELYLLLARASDETGHLHPDSILLAFFLVIWAATYKEGWDVESKYCAVKWGTLNFEEEEVDRPQFVGDPDEPRRLSPITYQNETYYPPAKRRATQFFSIGVVIFCVGVLLIIVVLLFEVQYVSYQKGLVPLAQCFPIIQSISIQIASRMYGEIAVALNDQENYRTQTSFENNLILKKFCFETVNNYAALGITAFVKGTYFVCTVGSNNCLGDTKYLLIAITATRYAIALWGVLAGRLRAADKSSKRAKEAKLVRKKNFQSSESSTTETVKNPIFNGLASVLFGNGGTSADDDDDDDVEDAYNAPGDSVELGGTAAAAQDNVAHERKLRDFESPRFEAEIDLEPYDGTFDDFAEIVLQMGLVTMFSLGWYFLPFFAMLETLLQIRVDAYKLVSVHRRPDVALAESVGEWGSLMDAMCLLAAFTNAGLVVFTSRAFDDSSLSVRLVLFLGLEQLLLAAKFATNFICATEPLQFKEIRKRQNFVVDRHKNVVFDDLDDDDFGGVGGDDAFGAADDDDADKQQTGGKRRGHVDRDQLRGTSRASAGSSALLGDVERRQLAYLRSRQTDALADRKIAEGEYRRAAKSEVLREDLGVSYSRRDPTLALGMVSLVVLEAENVGTRRAPVDARKCRLVIHVRDPTPRSERKYDGQPGPAPHVSKPARLPNQKEEGSSSDLHASGRRLVFNQAFTLAPIKTSKAEVLVELVDEKTRARLGAATLVLTDLANQQRRNLTLSINKQGAAAAAAAAAGPGEPGAVLYVKAQFQYSKIIPIKRRIYAIIEEQRKLARDIQNIQLGNPVEHNWEFPDSVVEGASDAARRQQQQQQQPGGGGGGDPGAAAANAAT